MRAFHRPVVALGPVLVWALAACSGDATSMGSVGGLTAAQTFEVGTASQDEVEASVSAVTIPEAEAPIGFARAAINGPRALMSPPGCPTISSTTDADGDGIPDDATLTFTNPPCVVTGWLGGSFAITGQTRVEDTNPANGFDFRLTLTDLTFSFTDPTGTRTYAAARNGTRSRTGTSDAATLTVDVTVLRQRPLHPDATLHKTGTVTFTAAVPGTLHADQPLPDGTIEILGALTWQRAAENFSFNLSTPVPLVYDATCTLTPQRIKAGELDLAGTVNGQAGTLILTWSACGVEPSRQWVAAASS